MEVIIEEFPEYKINTNGEVFSRYKYKTSIVIDEWRPLVIVLDKGTGYFLVTMINATTKVRKNQFIHRLLAKSFLPNPENKPHVNHIDGNKQNNTLSNLEWATSKENSQHAVNMGLTTYDHCIKMVDQVDLVTGELLATFVSMKEAYDVTRVQHQNISKVCRGLREHAGGFFWRYSQSSETIQ